MRFYQQVQEMSPTDRPAREVIEDDVALDRWYESYIQQAAAEASKQRSQRYSGGSGGGGIPASKADLPRFQP